MKKLNILILTVAVFFGCINPVNASFISEYPPAYTFDYVKATAYGSEFYPWYVVDPSKSLTGAVNYQSWSPNSLTNQRFHIDLGTAKVIKRVYYENGHFYGGRTETGAKNFTFWGSNSYDSFLAFNDFNIDTGWTQLTTGQTTFDQHVGLDQADPKYILVSNSNSYRFYAFKFSDNYGDIEWFFIRRIELQTEVPDPTTTPTPTDTPTPTPTPLIVLTNKKINICHYIAGFKRWNALQISINAWPAHQRDYLYSGPLSPNGKPAPRAGKEWCRERKQ